KAVTAVRMAYESGDSALFVGLCRRYATAIADAGLIEGMLRFLEIAKESAATQEEREIVLSLLATTAHRAANWQLVLKSTMDLKQLRERSTLPNAELALTEL